MEVKEENQLELSPHSLQMSSRVHSNWLDFGAESGELHSNDREEERDMDKSSLTNDTGFNIMQSVKREERDGLVGGFSDGPEFDLMEPAVKRQRLEAAAELSLPSTSYSGFPSLDVDKNEFDTSMDHPFSPVEHNSDSFIYEDMLPYDDYDEDTVIPGLLSSPGQFNDDDTIYSSMDCYNGSINASESNSQLNTSDLSQCPITKDSSGGEDVTESGCSTAPANSSQDYDEGELSDDSDNDFQPDVDEIDDLLDQGVEDYNKRKRDDACQQRAYVPPQEKQKVVLVERGHDPFDILPEGWVVVTHNSGMPVYLHKQSRVCTLSRPYFLGPGSARRHDIPVSAIPCFQYRRALEKEKNGGPNPSGGRTDQADETSENVIKSAVSDTSQATAEDNNDQSNAASTSDAKKPLGGVVVASAKELSKENSLDHMQLRDYCGKLFQFRTITVRRFQTWKDRRKHNLMLKKASRPALPSDTKLLTFPVVPDKNNSKLDRKREFVLNPVGKTKVGILHEYVQQALRVQPKYIFKELENGKTPYSATVVINSVQYGTGYASSKKAAKMEAARASLAILIPDLDLSSPSGSPKPESGASDNVSEKKKQPEVQAKDTKTPADVTADKVKVVQPKPLNNDLALFDEIKVEDPRVADLCSKAGQPSPYQILTDCLKRNYGLGDTDIHMEMHTLKHQRSEFTMRVGKHEAKVISKNKREGKHQAAQTILQKLHPHITSWGSLLRLYNWKEIFREKKEEKRTVGMLQSGTRPNKAILTKLRQEMIKLFEKKEAGMPATDDRLQVLRADVKASNLLGIDL